MADEASSQNIFYVYEHWRPDTGTCFYVGKGSGRRAGDLVKRNRRHKLIVRKITRLGLQIEIRLVGESLSEDAAFALEKIRIAFWKGSGVQLTNQTDGGEGPSNPSAEVRKKIGDNSRGRVASAATRAKMSAVRLGKRRSPEQCAKFSALQKARFSGKGLPAETRAKISASVKLVMNSEEMRTRMRITHTGKTIPAVVREKMSISGRRLKGTTEARALASEGFKARWRDPVFRMKILAKMVGSKKSAESRAKMSAARSAYWARRRTAKAKDQINLPGFS